MTLRGPQDLPDVRMRLLEQWRPPNGLYFELAMRTINDNRFLGADVTPLEPRFDLMALSGATLWWVKPDMCQLIQRAAESLPPTTLTQELVPSDFGFVVFETPLVGISSDGDEPLLVNAILWGTSVKLRADGQECLTASSYRYLDDMGSFAPLGRSDWPFGTDTDVVVLETADDRRQASMSEDRRWLASLFLLASQPLAEATPAEIPRPARKRSQRAKLSSDVRLINVRSPKRTPSKSDEPRHVDWSHRWIVGGEEGGFWRQQAYGPGHSLRRPVWIREYIKGPEDKPLKLKETVRIVRDER